MAATIHDVECVIFSTIDLFGDRLDGDSYNLIGQVVDHRHNRLFPHITDVDGPIPYSVCYVDDGIGIAQHLPLLPTNDGTPHYTTYPRPVDQTPVPCICPSCSNHRDVTLVIY